MIKRENYLKKIRGFYESDLIKIITGIRRCGKSVILQQIMEEINEKTDNVIYLNFEVLSVRSTIRNANDLIAYVDENRKQGKAYLFFDEIQVLNGWQDACRSLRLENNSIFITGSNSKLLSKEFTKELSGRYVSFKITPFVYKEIVEYAKQLNKEVSIIDYMIWGGFPNRFEFSDTEQTKTYLNDLVDTIVINDLINRYSIRKSELFANIVRYILISNARIFSARSIHKYINDNYGSCSLNTIIKYIDYLKEAYVIDEIKQYSTKAKKELEFYKKLYNEDVGLNSIMVMGNRYDLSHNLENIVFNELKYRNYDLKVFDNNGKEIDFIAEKKGKIYYVQVALSVAEEKAYEREFGAFARIDNRHQKVIITNDESDYSTSTVRHIRLKNFLNAEDALISD